MKSMVFSGHYGEVMYSRDSWLEHINCILYKIHFSLHILVDGRIPTQQVSETVTSCFAFCLAISHSFMPILV